MFTRTLFCTQSFAIISRPMKHCYAQEWQKLKLTFANSLSFAFIAALIDKQQDFRTIDKQMFTRTLFCTEKSYIISQTLKTLLRLRMTKAEIDFCKFFDFAFYSRYNWETTRRQLTNKCSQELYFVIENSFAIISQTYENTVMLRMTKAKIWLFCKFFEFCIL
jgi:hypothetical protein